jgi:hypothetical protein
VVKRPRARAQGYLGDDDGNVRQSSGRQKQCVYVRGERLVAFYRRLHTSLRRQGAQTGGPGCGSACKPGTVGRRRRAQREHAGMRHSAGAQFPRPVARAACSQEGGVASGCAGVVGGPDTEAAWVPRGSARGRALERGSVARCDVTCFCFI